MYIRIIGLCLISMSFMYFFKVYSGYSTFYCGFESHQGSMCNFKAETDSGTSTSLHMLWNRETGRPSSSTGPNMDHTYETSTGIIRLTKYKFSYTDVEKGEGVILLTIFFLHFPFLCFSRVNLVKAWLRFLLVPSLPHKKKETMLIPVIANANDIITSIEAKFQIQCKFQSPWN